MNDNFAAEPVLLGKTPENASAYASALIEADRAYPLAFGGGYATQSRQKAVEFFKHPFTSTYAHLSAGRLLGCISVYHEFSVGAWNMDPTDHGYYLEYLFRPSAERGKRIGHSLLRHAIKKLYSQDVNEVGLSVLSENYVAVDLYERIGFKAIATATSCDQRLVFEMALRGAPSLQKAIEILENERTSI